MEQQKQSFEYLRPFSLFEDATEQQREDFFSASRLLQMKKNDYIYMQGDKKETFYLLYSGKVKLTKIDDRTAKELIVSFKTKGDMFPELDFFHKEQYYTTSAILMEQATIVSIPIEKFEQLLRMNPNIMGKLLTIIGEKLLDLQIRLEDKYFSSTEDQVIHLLYRLATDHAVTLSNKKQLFLTPFQVKDLANMIGLSRETVGRVMAKLYDQQIIEKDPKGRLILNPFVKKR